MKANVRSSLANGSRAALIILLHFAVTLATAQELAVDWDLTRDGMVGPVTRLQNNMAVDWETGARFELEQAADLSDRWTLVKLDRHGRFKWSINPLNRHVDPISLLYREGAVYILVRDNNSMKVIKVNDLGSSAALAPEEPTPIDPSNGSNTPTAMIADPTGDGVIVTARFAHDNPGGRGFYNIMETRRVSAAGVVTEFDDFDLGTTGYRPLTSAKAFCSDAAGNVYATGASDAVMPPTLTDWYVYPSRLFVIKFDPAGHVLWRNYLPSPAGIASQGYDIEVDATGVYVLGQQEPEHAGPGVPPGMTGTTTLSKFDLTDGHELRTVRIPSRLREMSVRNYVERNALVLDGAAGSVYVAYDKVEHSTVGLDQYNTTLDEQRWSRSITIGETTILSCLIKAGNTIAVSTNNGDISAGAVTAIHAFVPEGVFADEIRLPGSSIIQMLPDAFGGIHTSSENGTTHISTRLYLIPRYPIIPVYVGRLEDFKFELFEEVHPEWDKFQADWSCMRPDCFGPDFIATLTANGKAIWQSSFAKPATVALPDTQTYPAFSLGAKSDKAYLDIFRISENISALPVKALSISSDASAQTLSISIETEGGSQVPISISILNTDGKSLGEYKLIAPFNKTFSDKFAEPVATISLNSDATPFTVSYYPNPSNGQFKLTLSNQVKLPASLMIYDGQGMKVHSQTLTSLNENVSLASPKPGLYLLKVITNAGSVTKTIQVK